MLNNTLIQSYSLLLIFCAEQEIPKKYENMTQIALLVSVTVCLIILIITSTFVFLRYYFTAFCVCVCVCVCVCALKLKRPVCVSCSLKLVKEGYM